MTQALPTLALFPGQGSQQVGMGKALFDTFDVAKQRFAEADEALGFSLSKICFEGPEEELMLTKNTQPAILTVSAIAYEIATSELGSSLNVVAAAGHSLGEYSALVAAEAISFTDAVTLVHKRGTYMQEAVAEGAGKMVAVLGKEDAEIEAALASVKDGVAQIANSNSPGQSVVAGDKEGVNAFMEAMGEAKMIELQVSAPFHSALMKPAEEKLAVDLEATQFKDAKFPIFANYSAEPVTAAEDVKELLRLQVCGRVRWAESMQNALSNSGVERAIEFGNGRVLTGLMRRIERKFPVANVNDPGSLEKLKA